MNDLAGLILETFSRFGLIGLWLVVAFEAFEFVASVPVGPILVFLGGLASQGIINVALLWTTVYSAVVVGDNLGFFVGRKFGRPILYRFGTKIIKRQAIEKADKFFIRFGAVAIFFSRFIFATVAAPLNVIVGASDLPWKKYLPAEMAGQAVWSSIYIFLGYFFGKQVDKYIRMIDQANVVGVLIGMLAVLIVFTYIVYRPIRHHVRLMRNIKK